MDQDIKLIIACEAFKGELEFLQDQIDVDIIWLEHSLHDVPDKLHHILQAKICEAEGKLNLGDTVLLFFGNCGGALQGLKSTKLCLTYPDTEDCIPIILGSKEKFLRLLQERPGTFFLNKAWIDSGQDPLHAKQKYVDRYGEKKGWRISQLMYKNYTHFSLIDNGCYDLEKYRAHVREACTKFDKVYVEEQGNLAFVADILARRCPMVLIPPGKGGEEEDQVFKGRKAFFPEEDKTNL